MNYTEKCKTCDGKCCRIYLGSSQGGSRDESVWFEDWCNEWQEAFVNSGTTSSRVKPLFDPLEAHLDAKKMLDLVMRNIDSNSCQYRGHDGCLLDRNLRPKVCRLYVYWKPEDDHLNLS